MGDARGEQRCNTRDGPELEASGRDALRAGLEDERAERDEDGQAKSQANDRGIDVVQRLGGRSSRSGARQSILLPGISEPALIVQFRRDARGQLVVPVGVCGSTRTGPRSVL